MVVATPVLVGRVDPIKSLNEIIRVAKFEAAIMAIIDGYLVGTLGLIKPTWWYGEDEFLTDRWNFTLPQYHHGDVAKALENEALMIAAEAGLPFINQGKIRKRHNGTFLMMPRAYMPTTE